MKAEKYTDFFEEAKKSMSKESIRRAEREANKIILNLGLAELRKHVGHSQSEITGYRQSSVSKIEARKDMKISTLVSYCRSLGLGVEINAVQVTQKGKSIKKNLLRTPS
ncbi:MAG: transcriptional regulator [Syntrophus sp. (in: bacteria)]|nr:transcriptional regulator [Syntrophus sp. (in: bacteria)]